MIHLDEDSFSVHVSRNILLTSRPFTFCYLPLLSIIMEIVWVSVHSYYNSMLIAIINTVSEYCEYTIMDSVI